MSDNDSVKVMCHHCDRSTQYTRSAITNELQRLERYNYEILTCQYCSRKYTKEDFQKALGITFTDADVVKAMEKGASITPEMIYCNSDKELLQAAKEAEDAINLLKEEMEKEETAKKLEEEIKKMQEGKEYDEKLVGSVDMEQGTPGDRRCVTFLKTEGEIYGYTYLAGKYIFKAIDYIVTALALAVVAVAMFIWEIIKKINWCIVCSAARIASFIGYGALLTYSAISLGVFRKPIFEAFYTPWIATTTAPSNFYTAIVWTALIVLACSIPMAIQICWAFGTPTSRWAKVIKKSADKLMK